MPGDKPTPSGKSHPGFWCSCEEVGGKHRIDAPGCRSRDGYGVLVRRPNGTIVRMLGRVINEHAPDEIVEDAQPMGQEKPRPFSDPLVDALVLACEMGNSIAKAREWMTSRRHTANVSPAPSPGWAHFVEQRDTDAEIAKDFFFEGFCKWQDLEGLLWAVRAEEKAIERVHRMAEGLPARAPKVIP